MNKVTLTIAGAVMALGAMLAGGLHAQRVNIRINKGHKSVNIRAGGSGGAQVSVHKGHRGHSHAVNDRGRSFRKVHHHEKIVVDRVWIPGRYVTEERRVRIPARTVHERVARRDRCGRIYYVTVCRTIPARIETKCVRVFKRGHYEKRERVVRVACTDNHRPRRAKGCNDVCHDHGHVASTPKRGKAHKAKKARKARKAPKRKGKRRGR